MTDTEPLYPLKELPQRYKISRTVIYERIHGLGIKLTKTGRQSYLTQKDVDRLDELHRHIDQGGTITEFTQNLSIQTATDIGLQIEPIVSESLIYRAFELLTAVNRQRLTDPIWQHERLEKCAENGWFLTSGEVKQLIGVKPSGEVFERGVWQFVRQGKIGRSAAWKVQKKKAD